MDLVQESIDLKIKHPINFNSAAFNANKYGYYRWLRENAPVYKGRVSVIGGYFLSHYDDCVAMLKDPRFVRNRENLTGKSQMTFFMSKAVALLAKSMVTEDDPAHRRLRNLVHKAFTPKALATLETRIDSLTNDLLDQMETKGEIDLMQAYSLPIPVTVISEMMGVDAADTYEFTRGLKALTDGLNGWTAMRSILWDLPKTTKFMRDLIARKRKNPGDDILSALIHAEDEGESLNEDELISMTYLLIIAGYETTVHLINNFVLTILQYPAEFERIKQQPELIGSAVEEVLRFNGPIHNTKFAYALEDVTIKGVTIPKGAKVVPLLGAANRDPAVFDAPERFDIGRTPNKHLGFGNGIHFCLGAPLARMETKLAMTNLIKRYPNIRLAVDPQKLVPQRTMLWHRYGRVPVILE